jgi:type IV pilus assembly protein PilV
MARSCRGFTLVELVVVMIVVAVGLLGLASMFGDNVSSLVHGEGAQRSAQYAQECAERVLAVRRNLGFDSIQIAESTSAPTCDSSALPTGFSRSVVISAYTGAACPSPSLCRQAVVTVSTGSVSAESTLMLVGY